MRNGVFWALIAVAVLSLVSACQSAQTPTSGPMEASQPAPTLEATAMAEPLIATTPTAFKATDAPAPLPTPTRTPPSTPVGTGNADVQHVRAVQATDGTWTFHVAVQHPDSGWEDYADGWDVLTPDGEVLKPDPDSPFTRLLLHPHENEQPFTRSQSGIVIPDDVAQVRVRAHDLVDGYGGREVVVDLTVSSGPGFEVER
jgi:hypothetical protein